VAELRDLLIRLSGARALPPMFAPFYTWLLRSGVEETLAFRILEAVSPADAHGQPLSAEQVSRVIEDRMTELVRVADVSLAPRDATVAFVGPAGAGKTTTLCKLAVHAYLAGATVDVLSLDDHGFGAAGPLEALSAILGVPYQQAATPDELAGVLERGLLRDVTVIDTPGVSPRDDAGVARLERMLRLARPTAVHLVLSATTKIDDALAAVNGFGRLGITHVLFSKLDETSTYGSVFSVGVLSGVPLSYFATGREIPNDIKPATARELARYVVRGG
jgi:flagellar biosynthesis protein FlhF